MTDYRIMEEEINENSMGITLPQISTMGLSRRAERQVLRAMDDCQAETLINCAKIASDMALGLAAIASQARVDQVVTELQKRNPRLSAQRNLEVLGRAHAVRMLRHICDDDDLLL